MRISKSYSNRIAVQTYRRFYRRLGMRNITSVFVTFEGTEYPTAP